MRRNHDLPRRQMGRSTVSLTTLSAPKAQPPVASTGVVSTASTTAATSAPRTNIIGANGGGVRGASRFVRGSTMSVMGRTRSAGAGSTCSNGDMHSAAAAGDAARVGEHLRSGGDVDVRDGRQWSLLHHASFHGRLAVVEVLLDADANKEARTAIQLTPLCLACQNGHQEVAEELLRRGASVAGGGRAGIDCHGEGGAAAGRHDGVGGGRGESNGDGSTTLSVPPTALFIAAREGHLSLVELLLARRGKPVSVLRGPDGKFAGDVFGKGVDEEARARIRTILAEAREEAWKEATASRDRQQARESGGAESEATGVGHHPPLAPHNGHFSLNPPLPRAAAAAAAAPVVITNGHRANPVLFSSGDAPAPAPAFRSEVSISPPEDSHAAVSASTLNHRSTVHARRASGGFEQPGCGDEADNGGGDDSTNGHHALEKAAGKERTGEGPGNLRDQWSGSNQESVGSRGVENGGGVRGDVPMSKPGEQIGPRRDKGITGNSMSERCINGRSAHSCPKNGHAATSSLPTTSPSASVFGLAVEQPLSATAVPATTPTTTRGRTPSRRGIHNHEPGVKGGGRGGGSRSSLALTSPGLPTPQEWQMCVRQNGLSAPPPPLVHDDKKQEPTQMQALSPNTVGGAAAGVSAATSVSAPTATRGIGPEAVILAPVDEVLDGDVLSDTAQDVRSRRSRSACGERSQVEFDGASPCEQWLKHPMPRSATAPPPTARSPGHMPLSPAGTVGGGGVVGDGDDSEFEDTWRLAFSKLMDLRTLYRASSGSGNGRSAAWVGWEEEKRALEETISELNMRLASKDHDIAELHVQLEERERDLRLMHGRDLERLGFSELSELEQRVQAALVLVQAKRERVVYKLLKDGGNGAGRENPRPDPVARS